MIILVFLIINLQSVSPLAFSQQTPTSPHNFLQQFLLILCKIEKTLEINDKTYNLDIEK